MSTLYVWREKIQILYAKYSVYILKLLQFLTGLIVFGLINSNIGFMEKASSVFCTAGLAVICTFFPMTIMTLAATLLVLLHFYALSMPIAAAALIIFLLMYIFYFRFSPERAWVVLLAAIAFGLKIPLVIPVAFGLMGTPIWIVPAACGIISYYMIDSVKDMAVALKNAESGAMTDGLMNFAKQLFSNKEMWLMLIAAVISILVVNMIRTRSVDHAWKIASAAGAVAGVIITAAGSIALGVSIPFVSVAGSAVLGLLVGLVLEFFFFSVDYSRTENVQFEDDEYYYYVKAIPKVGMTVPEKEVKHITGHEAERNEKEEKRSGKSRLDDQTDPEEILLTRSLSKELGLDKDFDKTK